MQTWQTSLNASVVFRRAAVITEVHRDEPGAASPARAQLLLSYRAAVYRYLLGATHAPDVAEELCQEFAIKVMEGKFRNVDANKGRFRDYLKRSLANLVNEHHRRRARAPGPLPDQVDGRDPLDCAPEQPHSFDAAWRDEVINQTWESLRRDKPVYFALLRLRVDNPSLTSRELAEQYQLAHDTEVTPAYVRKVLERAHAKFAALLLNEVAASLDGPDEASLRTELEHLDLLRYCRSALAKWKKPNR